jgi:predicted enzyme related to lactoylglutathione lyase
MGDPVVQFQILSRSPEETAQFYSNLFGWRVNADNPLGYREISTGAREGINGGIWPAPPQAPNFVQLFIAVDNVRMFSERAEKGGAKIIIPPTTLPDGGEMAVLHDPQGMSFGIVKRK